MHTMASARPTALVQDLGFLSHTPLVHLADRYFGEYADYGLALAIALALPFLRGALDQLVFKPLGRWMICGRSKAEPTLRQKATIYKWKESCWKALTYTSMAIAAFLVSYHEEWFTRSRALWEGCTQIPCNYVVPRGVRMVYCLEMAHYLVAIPSLLFWEVRRKDFAESLAHHIATLILIVYSYYINVTKVGAMVFLLHDVNDIFLELAKMCRYAKISVWDNVAFVIFVLSWLVSRLYIFPNWVIRSTLVDTLAVGRENNVNVHPHYEIFNAFLIFLLILHIYWTWLIFKVLKRALTSGGPDDVREDSDSDKED